jgi:hypothetical protein
MGVRHVGSAGSHRLFRQTELTGKKRFHHRGAEDAEGRLVKISVYSMPLR